MSSSGSARLIELLELSDEEGCVVLDVDALAMIAGDAETAPELAILLALLDQAAAQVGERTLARWVRSAGPDGQPIDALLARDFIAFERALELLIDRGLVVRGGGEAT